MDGFKRPTPNQRPIDGFQSQPQSAPSSPTDRQPSAQSAPLPPIPSYDSQSQTEASPEPPRKRRPRRLLVILLVLIAVLILAALGAFLWYNQQLGPRDVQSKDTVRFSVEEGDSLPVIAKRLVDRGVIRDASAFELYGKLTGKSAKIQIGTCQLSPSLSSAAVMDKLIAGCHDFKSITFFPGATIEKPLYKPVHAQLDQNLNIKSILAKSGYSDGEITAALGKQYQSPLFADKPAGSSLEGYVYGETYYVDTNATAEQVLEKSFAEMNTIVTKNSLAAKFKAQGLTLYQGITLASIVQRELNCEGKVNDQGEIDEERTNRCYGYQQTIAQIFLKRLKEGTTLGSDVTFIYAADQMKVTPTVDIDSPYNTRKYPGLPPGPIASPGLHALLSVANPSAADYMFFIAGDDGLIYFARTDKEHEANIKSHCQQLCNEL